MAKERELCVFCGAELKSWISCKFIQCGGTYQPACKACWRATWKLSEMKQCRMALESGRAKEEERLRAACEGLLQEEEEQPFCLRCGNRMAYGRMITLNTRGLDMDGRVQDMRVQPLRCDNCGKIELFDPDILQSWEVGNG